MATTMSAFSSDPNLLGNYLRDRRAKIDPASFGLPLARRRTPGLRREEVAQRANVSATWYTWLEQGRGGAPSADVLDRIARALMLTDVEREHLYLIGLGRPPEVRYQPPEAVSPRLQRVLDALSFSPAYIKTSVWDIIAWNAAAAAVLTDYGEIAPNQRNLLRMIFLHSGMRGQNPHWEKWRAGRSPRSVPTWRAPARRRAWKASSTSFAAPARNSRRSGVRTTCAVPMPKPRRLSAIRSPARSHSTIPPSPSTAARI